FRLIDLRRRKRAGDASRRKERGGMRKRLIPQGIGRYEKERDQKRRGAADHDRVVRDHGAGGYGCALEDTAAPRGGLTPFCGAAHTRPPASWRPAWRPRRAFPSARAALQPVG